MSKTTSTPILNPGKKSTEELERIFANRPLEQYINILSECADFTPISRSIDQSFDALIEQIESLLNDSLHLLKLIQQVQENKCIALQDYTIIHENILSAIASKAEEQITDNYKEIHHLLRCDDLYEDIVNEYLYDVLEVIRKYPVVHKLELGEEPYEYYIMSDKPTEILINTIEKQIEEVVENKKSIDESWMDNVLSILHARNAKMDRKMFRDVYDFLEVEGFISDEQLELHKKNTRQCAKEEYVKSAYFRLKKSRNWE